VALTKDRLELLVAHSSDIIIGTNREGRVVYYNDGASRSLGYSEEEILEEYVAKLYTDLDEARRVMAAMRSPEFGGKGTVSTFQTTLRSKGGELIPVAISGNVLYDDGGAEDGTIGFAKDLREIRRKDKLATLGEIAVGLSHEINNPLAVLLNQIELLEQDVRRLSGDEDCSVENERLDAMRREVSRVAEILERLAKVVETEHYQTVEYIGPARMIDLSDRRERKPATPQLVDVRILVVDDDLGICGSLTQILEAEGCKVVTAGDGEAGLRCVGTGEFDLVLTDVVMPKLDGYQLYHAIHEQYPGLPVLMMTAFNYDKEHIIKRSRIEGLKGVIFKKPVDPQKLCEVIRETLDSE
jgi:PAS domain S-box-containing protein